MMEPIITTSRNKGKGKVSHRKTPSNVSLPSEERGRASKPTSGPRSRSAVPATTVGDAPRPLILNDAPRPTVAYDSPPMFDESDMSSSTSGQSKVRNAARGPKKSEHAKPLMTLIHEGRGGTFYYGRSAMQKAIANSEAYGVDPLSDATNRPKAARGVDDASDYFLLTNAIGTEWLSCCVGVFFFIAMDRLFFAHIFIGKQGSPGGVYSLTKEDRNEVTQAVLARLEDLSSEQGWNGKNVILNGLTVATGQQTDPNDKTKVTSAMAVRDAVARFVNYRDPERLSIQNWGGFVIENGDLANVYASDQQIDDYSVSGHSSKIRADVWRYRIGKGWDAKLFPDP